MILNKIKKFTSNFEKKPDVFTHPTRRRSSEPTQHMLQRLDFLALRAHWCPPRSAGGGGWVEEDVGISALSSTLVTWIMAGWHGWLDEWMDGWLDGRMDGWLVNFANAVNRFLCDMWKQLFAASTHMHTHMSLWNQGLKSKVTRDNGDDARCHSGNKSFACMENIVCNSEPHAENAGSPQTGIQPILKHLCFPRCE